MKKADWQAILRNANPVLDCADPIPRIVGPTSRVFVVDNPRGLDDAFELILPLRNWEPEPEVLKRLVEFGYHANAEIVCEQDRDALSGNMFFKFLVYSPQGVPKYTALPSRIDRVGDELVAFVKVPRNKSSALDALIGERLPDRARVLDAFLRDARSFAGWPMGSHCSNVSESAGLIRGVLVSGTGDCKRPFSINLSGSMKVECQSHPSTIIEVSKFVLAEVGLGR